MIEIFITFIASFLIWVMMFGLIYLWFSDGPIRKEQALHAFFTALVAWGFASMIKALFPTERPFEVRGLDPTTITTPVDSSFPSIHSAVAFGIATSVFLHNKKWGTVFLVAALFVALGRVFSNVHFVGDIIAGAVLGILVSYAVQKLHIFNSK